MVDNANMVCSRDFCRVKSNPFHSKYVQEVVELVESEATNWWLLQKPIGGSCRNQLVAPAETNWWLLQNCLLKFLIKRFFVNLVFLVFSIFLGSILILWGMIMNKMLKEYDFTNWTTSNFLNQNT